MMRCPICNEEVRGSDQAERWGPEFAHATCVTAYNAGKADERERCAMWVRNNYQDHPNIDSLCAAMTASQA